MRKGPPFADAAAFPGTPAKNTIPEWCPEFHSVSQQVESGRARAVAAVDQELVATYWAIGATYFTFRSSCWNSARDLPSWDGK